MNIEDSVSFGEERPDCLDTLVRRDRVLCHGCFVKC